MTVAVAVVVFLVAYDNGGFGESTRGLLAIGMWWVVILVVPSGLATVAACRPERWSPARFSPHSGSSRSCRSSGRSDAGGAYAEFTRVALYVAVFALSWSGRTPRQRRPVDRRARARDRRCRGHRARQPLLPRHLRAAGTSGPAPGGAKRLSFPSATGTALAIFVALGIPLLLSGRHQGGNMFIRGLALVPVPAIGVVIYLNSSAKRCRHRCRRALAFLGFTARRWAATRRAPRLRSRARIAVRSRALNQRTRS